MIYAYIKRTGTLDPTDINLDIHINGEDFSAEVKPGPYTPFRGYFSAKHVDGNNVMLPISADDLLPEHYMVCEEKEAVLDVDARRSWTGTAKIELYIVYM